jgi:hypothetical protein
MNPNPSQFVNPVLSNLAFGWMQNPDGFVANQVFPVVPVDLQGGAYYEFNRGDFNRNVMRVRAPGTPSAGGSFRIANNPYYCRVFAEHKDLPQEVLTNFPQLQLEQAATQYLSQQAMISREIDWAARYFVTGVWGTTMTGVAANPGPGQFLQWNNGASTPIEDLRTGIRAVKLASGFKPNTAVFGKGTWDQIVDHPDVVDRIRGAAGPGNPAIVTKQAVAALLEIDRVMVMEAVQNTALEESTGAVETNAFIGGNHALLCYAAPSPGIMNPSAGYTFGWNGYLGGTQPVAVSSWWMQELKAQRVEIEAAYDQRLTSAAMGYFFLNAAA